MLALIETFAEPAHTAAWWLAVLWLFRCLCLWSFFFSGCPCCTPDCTACDSGSAPAQFQVVISGVVDGVCSCTVLNDTFVCSRTTTFPTIGAGDPTDCFWIYTMSEYCNNGLGQSYDSVIVRVRDIGANIQTQVRAVTSTVNNGPLTWQVSDAEPVDCSTYSSKSVDFFSGSIHCNNGVSADPALVTTL